MTAGEPTPNKVERLAQLAGPKGVAAAKAGGRGQEENYHGD